LNEILKKSTWNTSSTSHGVTKCGGPKEILGRFQENRKWREPLSPHEDYLLTNHYSARWQIRIPVMKIEGRDRFLSLHPEVESMVRDLPPDCVKAVILFGSQATGRAAPYSDIDICLLAVADLPPERKRDLFSYGSRSIHISILSDLPPSVKFRVFREGVLLSCTDDLLLHRAQVSAIREYLNVRPLIDRHIARTFG
jgi:predicted nucleotidyltransferase